MKVDAGIYIHVPFCEDAFHYCSFYSRPLRTHGELVDPYVDRLCDEITGVLDGLAVSADTVYFGGGTPSVLGPARIERILDTVSRKTALSPKSEITLEVNPVHAVQATLLAYQSAGINRMSLGIQTFSRTGYDRIGRRGGYADDAVLDCFFSPDVDHSVDFISGISRDIDTVVDLRHVLPYAPGHLSVYLLSIDEGTSLYNRFTPDSGHDEHQLESYRTVSAFLQDTGYEHYEVSNFARPGKRARHNEKYWTFAPYYGFGPGAHSFDGTARYRNRPSVEDYCTGRPVREYDVRTEHDAVAEFFLTGLRRADGVSESRFVSVFGRPFPDVIMNRCGSVQDIMVQGKKPYRTVRVDSENWPLLDTIVCDLLAVL